MRPEAAGAVTDYLSDVTQWTVAGMPACFLAILVIVALKFLQPAISNTLNTVSNSL